MPQRYITIFKNTMFYKKKLCPGFPRQSFSEIILAKSANNLISCFLLLDGAAERR
jgi:hypothetical protein